MTHGTRDVELLVIHDDPAEAVLMREEFVEHRLTNRVRVVHDVSRALAYLDGTTPDVVLLDLNLPGRDGRTVLGHLRAHPATAAVPVILLTDSPEAERILRAEGLPVQGYATKPVDFACLTSVVKSLSGIGFEVWREP
ncbi:response regulator [Actinoplanes aureus]|uniref:Response regulator n=1 Tax=Actinoplanes aureus TaxID=2792083 RepID=A0A931G060_9ACTN|nr:response regulator [Actinoplanes aureus]MBG0565452.1 response regulator [Actinoplanes aureus]